MSNTNVHSTITSCDSPNDLQVHGTPRRIPSGPHDSFAQRVLNLKAAEVQAEVQVEVQVDSDAKSGAESDAKSGAESDAKSGAESCNSDNTTRYSPDYKRTYSQMSGDSSTEEADETPPKRTKSDSAEADES